MSEGIPLSRPTINLGTQGFVYFIAPEPETYVKIGWCLNDPMRRLSELQTGCPEPLTLLACFPGALEEEKRLHRTFAELKFRGEWFYLDHKLADFVWYLNEDYPRGNPYSTRQQFEAATWDVLISGYDFPHRENLEQYKRSAEPSHWRHLHVGPMEA